MQQQIHQPLCSFLHRLGLPGQYILVDPDDAFKEIVGATAHYASLQMGEPSSSALEDCSILILSGQDDETNLRVLDRLQQANSRPLIILTGSDNPANITSTSLLGLGYRVPAKPDEFPFLIVEHGEMQHKDGFDVGAYWEARYASNRNSGSGSYGRLALFKARLINKFVREMGVRSVWELGCGDGAQLAAAAYPEYTGLDISETVVAKCKELFAGDSTKHFSVYDPTTFHPEAAMGELGLSLDVIYHLSSATIYQSYINHIFQYSSKYVIIYSNNEENYVTNVDPFSSYVRFRAFVDDVRVWQPNWSLLEMRPNRFPYSAVNPSNTSFADFYVFKKGHADSLPAESAPLSRALFFSEKTLNAIGVLDENILDIKQTLARRENANSELASVSRDISTINSNLIAGQKTSGDVAARLIEIGNGYRKVEESIERLNEAVSQREILVTELRHIRAESVSLRTLLDQEVKVEAELRTKMAEERLEAEAQIDDVRSALMREEAAVNALRASIDAERAERDRRLAELRVRLTKEEAASKEIRAAMASRLAERDMKISALSQQNEHITNRLSQVQRSSSFKAGRALVHAATSYTGAVRLPKALFKIWAERKGAIGEVKGTAAVAPASLAVRNSARDPGIVSQVPAEVQVANATTDTARQAQDFRVAMIADEFTTRSFDGEFRTTSLSPSNWRSQFEESSPEIFLCESAWSGHDSTSRPWKGQVYASDRFKTENRKELLEIIAHCKRVGIPTLFWNKEDPAHFGDKAHNFVETAKKFDFIFTTAAECIEGYKSLHGRSDVRVLQFATQPRIFNPIEQVSRRKSIIFAGSWYAYHGERSGDMMRVLDNLIDAGYDIEIFDRYYGSTDENHRFPVKYTPYLRPAVSATEVGRVYKSSYMGLNFNTVTDSQTMFARRVFELMSSNTLVLSNYSLGMDNMFGEDVVFVDNDMERLRSLTAEQIDRVRDNALHRVLTEHTYTHRWQQILSNIGINYAPEDNSTTLVWLTSSQDHARAAINFYESERTKNKNLQLLILVTDQVSDIDVAPFYQQYNRLGITVSSLSYIRRYGSRRRMVPTKNFVLIDPAHPPQMGWIERASIHLPYSDGQILGDARGVGRFRVEAPRTHGALMGRAELLEAVINSSLNTLVYYV